jgi:hypothetical protein
VRAGAHVDVAPCLIGQRLGRGERGERGESGVTHRRRRLAVQRCEAAPTKLTLHLTVTVHRPLTASRFKASRFITASRAHVSSRSQLRHLNAVHILAREAACARFCRSTP